MTTGRKVRVVALLMIRNEARYLARCLQYLHDQGIQTCVIDNDSTDESLQIAAAYQDRGVFRIEHRPYQGHHDLVGQLRAKEELAQQIDADWFIHHDADEIFEASQPGATLQEALTAVDRLGYNTVNFEEFVFVPTEEDHTFENTDYVKNMRRYYFFAPSEQRLQRAWKKQRRVDLVTFAGHHVLFEDKKVYPENFRLRHYIFLSRDHLLRKYGSERVYSREEVEQRQWHGARARFDPTKARLPQRGELRNLDSDGWDRSSALTCHPFFGE